MNHDGTVIRFAVCSEFDSHDSEPRIVSIHRNRTHAEDRIARRVSALRAERMSGIANAGCDWWIEPCSVRAAVDQIAPDRAAMLASIR